MKKLTLILCCLILSTSLVFAGSGFWSVIFGINDVLSSDEDFTRNGLEISTTMGLSGVFSIPYHMAFAEYFYVWPRGLGVGAGLGYLNQLKASSPIIKPFDVNALEYQHCLMPFLSFRIGDGAALRLGAFINDFHAVLPFFNCSYSWYPGEKNKYVGLYIGGGFYPTLYYIRSKHLEETYDEDLKDLDVLGSGLISIAPTILNIMHVDIGVVIHIPFQKYK